jgi:hypothetical protein
VENCVGWSNKCRCFGITGEVYAPIENVTFRGCSVLYRNATWDNNRVSALAVSVEYSGQPIKNVVFEDIDIYRKAQKYWDEHFKKKVYFSLIPDADTSAVKRLIRQKNLSEGFDVVIYDTLKADFTKTNDSDAIWISLIKDSREFEKLAKKYNLIFLCSLQLAMSTKNKLFIDGGEISSSKQVIETMESLLLLRSVYKEEFDRDNKHCFCNPKIRQKNAEGKYVELEFVSDTEKSYKMIFVGKSRNGANSNETGRAYLLEFNGDLGTFREVAYCTPKHSEIRS